MFKQLLASFPLLLIFFFLVCPTVFSESPAPSPAPPTGPPRIVSILKKAGHFSKFIRLLKKTQMDERIYSLLNHSKPITIFAPTNGAFAELQSDTIKSLSYQQRIQLVQFHVLNILLTFSEFQTVTNPLSTQAGDNSNYHYPLNVTMSGNQVNISTGMVNATVTQTIYTDSLLAVYEVDHVLLPLRFFVSPPPVPAPPLKPEEAPAPSGSVAETKASGAVTVVARTALGGAVGFVCSVLAAFALCL